MPNNEQLAKIINTEVTHEHPEDVEVKTINEYKKLNEKCDAVICKIKDRKKKKTSKKR